MHKVLTQQARWLIAALLFALPSLALASLQSLEPTRIHERTAGEIVAQLSSKHYRSQAFDQELSSRFLDNLLRNLDPGKSYFLQADIDEFNKQREQFGLQFGQGKLDASFAVFERYRQRADTRLSWVLEQLADEELEYDFDADEYLIIDRELMTWATDGDNADQLWHKRIKSGLLNLMLAGRTLEESKEVLTRRYTGQQRRLRQHDADDAFGIIVNALTTLYDPHTGYLSPRNIENFNINMSLSLEGIGAVLQTEDEHTKVLRLVPAGPADRQGELRPSDRIVAVGQGAEGELVDVVGWRLDEVVDLIRGPKDSIVRLEVLPASASIGGATQVISIKRETVKLEDQAARKAIFELGSEEHSYRLGVIQIPTFYMDFEAYRQRDPNYRSTTRDVRELLRQLEEAEVDGIIIDLRNNGGGSLQEATALTDLFVDQGPVVQIRQTNELISRSYRSHAPATYRGPLVVLINRLSASASEIFAGAIQDYGRGVVIGSPSFGKGSVQSLVPLRHGQLKVTESKFYRISGESTQNRGVEPDLELPSLFRLSEVGEASYDHSLPWDTIHSVPHRRYFDTDKLVEAIRESHEQRVAKDPDFVFFNEQMAMREEHSDITKVSLRKSTRLEEQQAMEARSLAMENRRRKAKGQSTYETYAAMDEENGDGEEGAETAAAPDPSTDLDPYSDPFLTEAGNVLIDFIEKLKTREELRVANF